MTGFVKRGLIHASNFSNLRICCSACIGSIALNTGSRTFLSLYLYDRKFQPISLLINEVMPLEIWKIECMYKAPYHKSGHMYIYIYTYILYILVVLYVYIHSYLLLQEVFFQYKKCLT